ncbi:MAG: hypothetical protein R3279_10150 [Putridiphycobacter sp.]|nr:hypothetical protein [Putridiphycobacter sp.]
MPKDTKEIENRKEKTYGWLAFLVLVIHFGLILFSILPATKITKPIHAIAKQYAEPIFKQRWAMFAPCPTLENRIKVKFYFENDTTDWIDPIDDILPIHQTLRFSYHGNIAVGYYNMLYWLKLDIDKLSITKNELQNFSDLNDLRNTMGNRLLHKYVFGYANETFQKKPHSADLIISYRSVVDGVETTYLFSNYK